MTTRLLCLAALATLVIVAIGFEANIGFVALTLAFVLQLATGLDATKIVARIPWSVVLLIGGILTYIGVMQEIGAFAKLGEWLTIDGSPLLSLLALAYVAGVTSFFASSIAVFATVLPLVPPLVAAGVDPVSALVVVALSSVLVDVNPFGITGGLILGSTAPEDRDTLFKQLLAYGVVSTLVAPLVVWALCSWW